MRRPVLYYIRHGETDWNAEHRLQGQADTPLNAVGEGQAQRCGKILRKLLKLHERDPADLDYVSSPLSRARVTMELIRTALGLDSAGYRIDPRLIEMSFGEWDGLDFAALQAQQAAALRLRQQDPWRFRAAGRRKLRTVAASHSRLVRRDHARHGGLCASVHRPRAVGASWPRAADDSLARPHRACGGLCL